MNNYEDWAHLVAKKLKGEADVIAAIEKEELDDAAATEAFVRAVLKPFLPENFGVGSGRIVDAFGNRSDHLEIVVYNRNFPRIGLRGTQADYLYESVLAAFAIRAKYVRKTFFDSMDACASLARLEANTDTTVLMALAKRNGLKPGPNKTFVHSDPLQTARFELIGRPPAFMFGFTGFQGSLRQLQENLELWLQHRKSEQLETPMRAFPAVIATQGCFAWRNAAPLALNNREMLGIGTDEAPIRLIVLQLLHLLNRRLHATPDAYGMKPNLSSYLRQFSPPKFEQGVGPVDELVKARGPDETGAKSDDKPRSEPARDRAQQKSASNPAKKPVREAAAAGAAAAAAPQQPEAAPEQPEPGAAVFEKPSPFASAPKPAAKQEEPAAAAEAAPSRPPAPALGSAPIPGAEPEPPARAEKAVPPKTPVDIDVTGETELPESIGEDTEPDYDATVVIAPDASLSRKQEPDKQESTNSTDAFIARVKQQLSNPEPLDEKDEPFTSTIPQ